MIRYRIDHPLRPTNWRWERARVIREMGERSPFALKQDKWVDRAAHMQLVLSTCKDESERYRALDMAGDLGIAYDIWDDGTTMTPPSGTTKTDNTRHELEARILARQPLKDIANRMSLQPAMVHTYEKIFFHVTDRLNNASYIVHQVLGPVFHMGLTDKNIPLLWKAYGYFTKSPAMIDALTSTFSTKASPTANEVDKYLADDGRATLKRKSALAARMLPLNDYTQDRLLELNLKAIEEEVKQLGGAVPDGSREALQMMLGLIPWSVGKPLGGIDANPLVAYDNKAAELRADEALEITMNGTGAPSPDTLATFKFPEPEKPQ